MAAALLLLWRGRLFATPWALWALMLAAPFPYIATTAGWMTTELGRQPWLVYGLMRTAEGTSPLAHSGNALFTLIGFLGLYLLLGLIFLFLVGFCLPLSFRNAASPERGRASFGYIRRGLFVIAGDELVQLGHDSVDGERARYWIGKGAKPSKIVHQLFKRHGVYAKGDAPAALKEYRAFLDGLGKKAASASKEEVALDKKARARVDVLDAAGFDTVIVETVGAGQSEVDIARLAGTSLGGQKLFEGNPTDRAMDRLVHQLYGLRVDKIRIINEKD